MDFWGLKVDAGITVPVMPPDGHIIHISQVSLGGSSSEEPVNVYVTVNGVELSLGTLTPQRKRQLSLDVLFAATFHLHHDLKVGALDFIGYTTPNIKDEDVDSEGGDFNEEEFEAMQSTSYLVSEEKEETKTAKRPNEAEPVFTSSKKKKKNNKKGRGKGGRA
uniref:Histone deacetylase HDT1 n=1 Tax=Noccaea caerulescens TaxID=107243 RepID=A0A1J3DEZ5_NOCCA